MSAEHIELDEDISALMEDMGQRARAAQKRLSVSTLDQRTQALLAMAASIRNSADVIAEANKKDMTYAATLDLSAAMLDRLELTPDRIEAMAAGVESIANMPDPVGRVTDSWDRPNGLSISRVRTPLGVIGVIYESRPNVTADAGALCLKAGNAAILRGGKEGLNSGLAIHAALVEGLKAADLPEDAIQLVPTRDRAAVGHLLTMTKYVDVIVPRGGKSLVARVEADSRVPVFAHLEGLVHMYIHAAADPAMARDLILNAKMRRTGICGALETILVDQALVSSHLPGFVQTLLEAGCEVRGDETVQGVDDRVQAATAEDWSTEYLAPIVAVKVVQDLDAAIHHIETYGSHHTDCIVTADQAAADRFQSHVDSAIVMHNASTQFADGGEFGMGAEIGISTGRMHARGPVGAEQLTTFKYVVRGTGQVRP